MEKNSRLAQIFCPGLWRSCWQPDYGQTLVQDPPHVLHGLPARVSILSSLSFTVTVILLPRHSHQGRYPRVLYRGVLSGLVGVNSTKDPVLVYQCIAGGLDGSALGCGRNGSKVQNYAGE